MEALERQYRAQGWWSSEPLADRYRRTVRDTPHATAVADSRGRSLTHAGLWARTEQLVTLLTDRGIEPGDVLLIVSPNLVEWQIALLATLRMRAVPATVPTTTDPETLRHLAELIHARLIVAGPPARVDCGELALDVQARCEGRVDALLMTPDGDVRWSEGRGGLAEPLRRRELEHVFFTSSTTGRPKAVMHTVETVGALHQGFADRFALGRDTPIFMASPVGHSVGSMHGGRLALYLGAPLVLQERWDPEEALALVAEHRCAFTAAATPFLKDLVDASWDRDEPKLAPLRAFLCGGAPVPPALMTEADAQFPNTLVTVLWGMTEGGVTTCLPGDPAERRAASAGLPLPGLELRALAGDGTPLPAGQEGELAMRGPGVFVGYLGQRELYESSLDDDGFFRTGDLAKIDRDGYLYITGRVKDLIIRGGVNISPVPIENALAGCPGVRRVAVIGLPDERMGERICAVVVPAGEPPDLDDLIGWARDARLPRRLWPEALRLVDEMPVTAAGKIRKNVLAEQIRAGEPVG